MFAIDNVTASSATQMWIQLLTGVAPTGLITAAGGATATTSTVSERTISKPASGASTGSALIGAYGFGVATADLQDSDLMRDLDDATRQPPNNVQFDVTGLVSAEDYVLVAPTLGTDVNGDPAIDETQMTIASPALTGVVTSITVNAIPNNTPASGTLRVIDDLGEKRLVTYSSYTGAVFTVTSIDFTAPDDATIGNGSYITYIDKLAGAATESANMIYTAPPTPVVVLVRDGKATPIKQFIQATNITATGGGAGAIRTTDE